MFPSSSKDALPPKTVFTRPTDTCPSHCVNTDNEHKKLLDVMISEADGFLPLYWPFNALVTIKHLLQHD